MHALVVVSAVCGAVVIAGTAILFAFALLNRPRVRSWLDQPPRFPYWQFLRARLGGLMLSAASKVGPEAARRVSPKVAAAFNHTTLDDYRKLQAALEELEALPTVQRGLAALGLRSIFQVPHRAVHRISSPYTAPLQRPAYYVPGVPARTFYDPADFPWVEPLERAFPVIKRELLGVLGQNGRGFKAYMNETVQRLEGWNTFNFFFYGRKYEENCALCPETAALIESLPRFERDHIMFSALNPHSHIPPHTGPMNGIIRGHLALVAPPECYIKVGDDERTWEEGKVLVFDDSYQHEVWNHGDHVRIVLFLNFWHPCFSPEEIAVLQRFRTAYERSPLGRVHEDVQAAQRAHDVAMEAIARGAASDRRPTTAPA